MAMTVGELKQALEKVPDDMPVILSSDGEGNSYSPLASWSAGLLYEAYTTWYGEVHNPTDPDDTVDGDPCLVLWPTN